MSKIDVKKRGAVYLTTTIGSRRLMTLVNGLFGTRGEWISTLPQLEDSQELLSDS